MSTGILIDSVEGHAFTYVEEALLLCFINIFLTQLESECRQGVLFLIKIDVTQKDTQNVFPDHRDGFEEIILFS